MLGGIIMALIKRLISPDKYNLKCPYPMIPKEYAFIIQLMMPAHPMKYPICSQMALVHPFILQ